MKTWTAAWAVVLGLVCLWGGAETRAGEGHGVGHGVGINLTGVNYYMAEWPFVDVFRTSKPFHAQKKGERWGVGEEHEMRADGYPKKLLPGHQMETLLFVNAGKYPGGRYVCLYDGKGRLQFWGDAKVVEEKPGRVVVELGGKSQVGIRLVETDAKDPLHNVRLVHEAFEKTYEQRPFAPDFLARWRGMEVVRFMDWQRTNGSKQQKWEGRPKVNDQTQGDEGGVAVELMVDLANTLGADPWFCLPHLADDEYVREFAELVKGRLDPKRKVYVEHSNEVWNGQFEQARYAARKGKELGLSDNAYQAQLRYHSQRSVEIFSIWAEVFGEQEGRLVRVLASHSVNPWASEQVVTWKDAYKHADALGVAPYFGHAYGDPKKVEETLKLTVEQVLEGCRAMIAKNKELTAKQAALAKKYGLQLVAYEGGQHLVGHGGAENNQALTELFTACNRHPLMGELYREDLKSWREAGGGVFVVFSSVSSPSKWGHWGLMESAMQEPGSAPKYRAVRKFMEAGR